MCRKILLALWALVCLAPLSLVAQQTKALPKLTETPVTGLHVLSATLNPVTHQIDVQLHNTSNKTAVAYVLHIKGFDAEAVEIQDDGIGLDYINADNPGNLNTRGYILAGSTASELASADPRALTVEVSVMGVVYLDRTFEGRAAAGTTFDARRNNAVAARQALALLKTNPATPQDTRDTMRGLLEIDSPLVDGALANHLNLPSMPDRQHLPARSSFTKQQWDDVKKELTRKAESYETISQEVAQ